MKRKRYWYCYQQLHTTNYYYGCNNTRRRRKKHAKGIFLLISILLDWNDALSYHDFSSFEQRKATMPTGFASEIVQEVLM
jgi:hypothetical protein